jgi:drug/metabolite transporter (DMT)-like permease
MKLGMFENHDLNKVILTPYEVAAIRMLAAGVIMLPFALKAIKNLPKNTLVYVVTSGLLGSFFPAFLFCIAETKVGGGIAGSLNALTPLFVILVGALFFKLVVSTQKILGVLIGLIGSGILIYANIKGHKIGDLVYIGFIIIATFLYGLNVNMVIKKLNGVPSLHIAAIAFSILIVPSLIILYCTGYFSLPLAETKYAVATTSAIVLGVLGTALASILFYTLLKRAGGIFASTVTYGIPFVAIAWGLVNHENITIFHFAGLIVILGGVYLANK